MELDTDLVDFYRTRVIERKIVRDPDAKAEAEAEYRRWWWTNTRAGLICHQTILWPDGQPIVCHLPLAHQPPCIGQGDDGHERAFTL